MDTRGCRCPVCLHFKKTSGLVLSLQNYRYEWMVDFTLEIRCALLFFNWKNCVPKVTLVDILNVVTTLLCQLRKDRGLSKIKTQIYPYIINATIYSYKGITVNI